MAVWALQDWVVFRSYLIIYNNIRGKNNRIKCWKLNYFLKLFWYGAGPGYVVTDNIHMQSRVRKGEFYKMFTYSTVVIDYIIAMNTKLILFYFNFFFGGGVIGHHNMSLATYLKNI